VNWFYPNIKRSHLPAMLGITLLGGLLGGVYGAIHDWMTYVISSEYFTRMKFDQFSYLDTGLPPRWHAAQIGFIAAGAVGLAGGWFVARTAVPRWPARMAWRQTMISFLIMIVVAMAAGLTGNFLGHHSGVGAVLWNDLCATLHVTDAAAFQRVALIHTAGYPGALAGLILAILLLRRSAPVIRVAPPTSPPHR
jgi:hypothetical protein